jgi:hypothetical protein
VRIDAKGAGRVGKADVVDTDMGLRQDNENSAALRKSSKPRHVADLRSDLGAQSRIRKGPRRGGCRDRDKQGGTTKEYEEYSRQAFAGRRGGTRNDRCRFNHGSRIALDGIARKTRAFPRKDDPAPFKELNPELGFFSRFHEG